MNFTEARAKFFRYFIEGINLPCRIIKKENGCIWRDNAARLCWVELFPAEIGIRIITHNCRDRIKIGDTINLSGIKFKCHNYRSLFAALLPNDSDDKMVFTHEEGSGHVEFVILKNEVDDYSPLIIKYLKLMSLSGDYTLELLMMLQALEWEESVSNSYYHISKKAFKARIDLRKSV